MPASVHPCAAAVREPNVRRPSAWWGSFALAGALALASTRLRSRRPLQDVGPPASGRLSGLVVRLRRMRCACTLPPPPPSCAPARPPVVAVCRALALHEREDALTWASSHAASARPGDGDGGAVDRFPR